MTAAPVPGELRAARRRGPRAIAGGGGAGPRAGPWRWRIGVGLLGLIAVVALVMAIVLWQKVGGMQEQLARQSADATAQAAEARALARQAQDVVRDTAGRLALMESRVAGVALQHGRARGADAEPLALHATRTSWSTSNPPCAWRRSRPRSRATCSRCWPRSRRASNASRVPPNRGLRRCAPAMQHDADASVPPRAAMAARPWPGSGDLLRSVDGLPPLNALAVRGVGGGDAWQNEAIPADAAWWERILLSARNELRRVVRVSRTSIGPRPCCSRPTRPPRENLKLKLLNSARLALLSRQVDNARTELASVSASLNRYFDPASRRVRQAATLLQQVQAAVKASAPPRIDETLAALATAAARR